MTTKTISAAEARKRFAEIIDEVSFSETEYIVMKHGKNTAKITGTDANTSPTITPEIIAQVNSITKRFQEDLRTLADK